MRAKTKTLQVLWIAVFVAGLAWYGQFRVIEPLRYEPFTAGFNGNDFKHFYLGAWMLVHGQDPYDARALLALAQGRGLGAVNPYVYLPFTGLVLSPLTLLDPAEALRAWFALNHLFLLGALVLIFWSLRIRPDARNLAVAAWVAALCYPLHRTLTAGQLNCALLLLFAAVYALESRGRFIAAGAVAAFAALFKIIPGVLILYFLWQAIRRRDRFGTKEWLAVFSMVGFSLAFLGISVAWVGMERHLAFRPLLSEMAYGRSTWAGLGQHFYRDPSNQSLNSFFHHVLVASEETRPWINAGAGWANGLTRGAVGLCWLMAGIALLMSWRKASPSPLPLSLREREKDTAGGVCCQLPGAAQCRSDSDSLTYGIILLLALLTPSLYWDHYALIALWPLFALYARLEPETRSEAFLVFLPAAFALGTFLDFPRLAELSGAGGRGMLLALGIGLLTAWLGVRAIMALLVLLIRYRPAGLLAVGWALAGALLVARFLFDYPSFRTGVGLLAMSEKLWGTLLLFGLLIITLCATNSRVRWGD